MNWNNSNCQLIQLSEWYLIYKYFLPRPFFNVNQNIQKNIPKAEPAARPILRAKIGGRTPSGFSLSVRPNLSKSMVNGKLIVIFDRNPSNGYRTKGNDSVGVILSTVPGGNASRPSSVIQINRFLRECGLFASSDSSDASFVLSAWFCWVLVVDAFDSMLSTASVLFGLNLLGFWFLICSIFKCAIELLSFDCCILWHETIEIITIVMMAFSHNPNSSMV